MSVSDISKQLQVARDYSIRVVSDPAQVDAGAWDALLATQTHPTPFMRHAFLAALVQQGDAAPATGWHPRWVMLEDAAGMAAAAPAWLKTHSRGEYVFDFAWADAHHRHGLTYYPKLVVAVPFNPVPGSRLLARDADARDALISALRALAQQADCSSAHLLFAPPHELNACAQQGWLHRSGVQFHWHNQVGAPWPSFEAFLASLKRDKRKKMAQERRRVATALAALGAQVTVLEGTAITAADWAWFHRAYSATYLAHGNAPYLSAAWFAQVGKQLAPHWLMVQASRAGQPMAAALLAIDRASGVAWGRWWGATEHIPLLHFELCYYAPLEWCISQRFVRFEGGAQGEHKLARGFDAAPTGSAHWLAHPAFARAVDDYLAREGEAIAQYTDELRERSALRSAV